jgi:hypothetical protein
MTPDICFAVPTFRLRDVGETIAAYDANFWRNGHTVPMIVFDDSTIANCQKYYSSLEATPTANELFYVGPKEKEQFVGFLCKRLHDRKLAPLVKNLFRPSYGGNRNVALMYTLGSLLVSADDDMRPFALVENSVESLAAGEISRGKLVKSTQNGYTQKSYDILASFKDVLGKRASEVPANYERGELIVDSAMNLETNTSKEGLARDNSLLLKKGKVPPGAIVKMAQTFRSGTNDIDAMDYAHMFLEDERQTDIDALNDFYVLVNFRPVVTNKNWRMDCGVAGYDNTLGLPPFFPTRLRFEDYIYRLWIQQPGLVAAHVDSVQTHMKNNYMRSPLAAEVFNETICSLLKKKILASLHSLDPLNISFDYEGEVTLKDTEEILEEVNRLRESVLKAELAAAAAGHQERERALRAFVLNLERAFYGFESDFFQQNVARMVDDVISLIKGSLDLWPTLVEICYFQKDRKPFPMTRVKNKKRNGGHD